jgi:hypothetical protein
MAPDRSIKEVTITNTAYEDIKAEVISRYEEESGERLTEGEKMALLIAFDSKEKTDIDYYTDKEKQARLSDLLSGSPSP